MPIDPRRSKLWFPHARPTRRTVLKGAAAAASVPLVACASTSLSGLAGTGPPRALRVGLVGCGGRGSGAAWNALHAEDGTVVLTAVGDAFADRLETCLTNLTQDLGEEQAERLQVPAENRFVGFDAYRKVIEADVDVVLLATPPAFRPQHLAYAIERGKHVFTEKPMAVDAPGVRSVLATARRAAEQHLSLVSGFCWRYNAAHRATYGKVHDGALGTLRAVYGSYNATPIDTHSRQAGWTDVEWMLRNWHHFHELSGDHVTEQAVHTIDKIAWAFGDVPPLSVMATGGCQTRKGPEKGNTFDHFSAVYDYPGGAKAFLMCRQMPSSATENNDYLYGSRGRCEIQNWTPLHLIEGEEDWEFEGEHNDMYQAEHDALFASIRAGEPLNDGEWMARSTLLAVMARMSAYTGQVVTWQQALESEQRLTRDEYAFGAATPRSMAMPGETKLA